MKKYRAVVIGCGAICPTHAVSLRACEKAELLAVCDKIEERAKTASEKYNCKYYTDWREMVEKEKPDVVHICLPHYLHAPVAIECMRKGMHVLTEKPMATTVADAEEMIRVSKETGKTLSCIFQNRFNDGTQLVRNMFLNGELGKAIGAKCTVTWLRTGDYYTKSDWKGTWDKEGGGVIIDQAIHTLDAMRYIMNAHPVTVDATIAHRGPEQIEVEDTAEGAILFDNGVRANFHAINYYSFDDAITIDIDFEKGLAKIVADAATVTMKEDGKVYTAKRDPSTSVDYGDIKSYWGVNHSKQIDDFYDCLETDKEMFVDLDGAFETLKMVMAIYESGKTGKKVNLK